MKRSLVREHEKPRVEYNGEQDVAAGDDGEREDHSPVKARDLPARWDKTGREDGDGDERRKADNEREPEAAQDTRHLDLETW